MKSSTVFICGFCSVLSFGVAIAATAPTAKPSAHAMTNATDAKLKDAIAGAWRAPNNVARDKYRHPKETLEFFGVKPGMNLIEITPGGGWYSEILAPFFKGNGTYTAAVVKPKKKEGEDAQDMDALHKKFAGDAAEYSEAKFVEYEGKAPNFGADGSADMVVTFRNVHNWVIADTAPQMFKAFYSVLKPGGVLGITDHRAAKGADLAKIKKSGYLPEDFVIKLATDAGFKLAGKSEVNANPKDTKDYAEGVWTLPPTLELKDKDREKYVAIGESDRMTLKFVKPGSDKIFSGASDTAKPDAK
ncbi:MAG: methyltransferase [Rudaea sp.]